jgi:SAM-dependent methyltransferase
MMRMNTTKQNSIAWDKKVEENAAYTMAVSPDMIKKAKCGEWEITITAGKPVPRTWFPKSLDGLKVLCLASGGGQQGPVLAAAGADVTVVDISKKQLEQDEMVAQREGLMLKTVLADMTDLSMFANGEFDLIVHPVANLFVEDISKVWMEASRVLKEKGVLISGFVNPLLFIFDDEEDQKGNLAVKNPIPSSSLDNLTDEEITEYMNSDKTIEFGHTLESQIQGQIDAGFVISGLYEDDFGGRRPLDRYIKCFIATRSVKLKID